MRITHSEPLFLRPGQKLALGDKQNRACRFCGLSTPAVTFNLVAHAIPELMGNKSLISYYECDNCNQFFGRTIENDLGNWSKPNRTFARIRGKTGVPTLKKGGPNPGWRIEYGEAGFDFREYEDDPIFAIDEAKKQVRFDLKRDSYTPVAVLKAFAKINLTIMPSDELPNFKEALAWIREPDHARPFLQTFPLIWTFIPSPMPNDLIVVWLFRRKPSVTDLPYTFMVLSYGNDVFQVSVPSPLQDASIDGKQITFPAFPTPGSFNSTYGRPRVKVLDLTGKQVVRGEVVSVAVGFDSVILSTRRNEEDPRVA